MVQGRRRATGPAVRSGGSRVALVVRRVDRALLPFPAHGRGSRRPGLGHTRAGVARRPDREAVAGLDGPRGRRGPIALVPSRQDGPGPVHEVVGRRGVRIVVAGVTGIDGVAQVPRPR